MKKGEQAMASRTKSIAVKVDALLYKEATTVLKSRGTDIETWVTLQLRAFAKSGKSMLGLRDKISFGKYQGALVEDIIRGDLKYAIWLLGQNGSIKWESAVLELAHQLSET